MSENDGFDEIVNSEESDDLPEFESIFDVIEYYWPKLNPGLILVKGTLLVEAVGPEGRGNGLESSSPITDADILGLCEWAKAKVVADINAVGWAEAVALMHEDDEEEDADDDE